MDNLSEPKRSSLQEQQSIISLGSSQDEQQDQNNTDDMIMRFSQTISSSMFQFYRQYESTLSQGKILGKYQILKFPTPEQTIAKNTISIQAEQIKEQPNYSQPTYIHPYVPPTNTRTVSHIPKNQGDKNFYQIPEERDEYNRPSSTSYQGFTNGAYLRQYQPPEPMRSKQFQMARKHYRKLEKEIRNSRKLKRKFKDKNRPKKAKSAYNLFVQDVVPQIKAQNPTFNAPDLVRVAAKMYNKLTQQEKIPLQRRYMKDKQRFDRQRQEYFRLNPQMDYRFDAKKKAQLQNIQRLSMESMKNAYLKR